MNKKDIWKVVTTPAYYPNGEPHLGHYYSNVLAGYVASLNSLEVLSGNDVHGRKMRLYSKDSGSNLANLIFSKGLVFKQMLMRDLPRVRFQHTHSWQHRRFVKEAWSYLLSKAYLYEDFYRGYYSVREESFVVDFSEKEKDLIFLSERNLFLDVNNFKERLKELYLDSRIKLYPDFYFKQVWNLIPKLGNLCVTRKEIWGLKAEGVQDRTIYVWVEALMYYLSSLTSFKDSQTSKFKFTQVIGKDILTFHGVYWPILLMALDVDFELNLIVTGWALRGSEKLSKSLGNYKASGFGKKEARFLIRQRLGRDFELDSEKLRRSNKFISSKVSNLILRVWGILRSRHWSHRKIIPIKFRWCLDLTDKLEALAIDLNRFIDRSKPWKRGSMMVDIYLGSWVFAMVESYPFYSVYSSLTLNLDGFKIWNTELTQRAKNMP